MTCRLSTPNYVAIISLNKQSKPNRSLKHVLFLMFLFVTAVHAADELERFTLRDGRELVGVYDSKEQRLLVATGKLKAWVPVAAKDIASRELVNPPAATPTPTEVRLATAAVESAERQAIAKARAAAAATALAERDHAKRQAAWEVEAAKEAADRAVREAKAAAETERLRLMQLAIDEEESRTLLERRRRDNAAAFAYEEDRRAQIQARQLNQDAIHLEFDKREEAERAAINQIKQSERDSKERKLLIIILLAFGLMLSVNFLPVIVAVSRRHRFRLQVGIINMLSCAPILWMALRRYNEGHLITEQLLDALLLALCFVMWSGALVWATWPGLGVVRDAEPAPIQPRARRRSPIAAKKSPYEHNSPVTDTEAVGVPNDGRSENP